MAQRHRKIVLTGGPGAGKTAVLEIARRHFGSRVEVLRESATIVFTGGFPRLESVEARCAAQRAIYHVQVELENVARAHSSAAIVLCDRGTLDGLAYWPGTTEAFAARLHTSVAEELARYDCVIHLATPSRGDGYHRDAVRTEGADAAELLDRHLAQIWEKHPRRFVVDSARDFMEKARRTLAILAREIAMLESGDRAGIGENLGSL